MSMQAQKRKGGTREKTKFHPSSPQRTDLHCHGPAIVNPTVHTAVGTFPQQTAQLQPLDWALFCQRVAKTAACLAHNAVTGPAQPPSPSTSKRSLPRTHFSKTRFLDNMLVGLYVWATCCLLPPFLLRSPSQLRADGIPNWEPPTPFPPISAGQGGLARKATCCTCCVALTDHTLYLSDACHDVYRECVRPLCVWALWCAYVHMLEGWQEGERALERNKEHYHSITITIICQIKRMHVEGLCLALCLVLPQLILHDDGQRSRAA